MTLYTRKGDDGTTKTFGCDQRISKSSEVAEALGSLDEINSFLGLIKVKSQILKLNTDISILGKGFDKIIDEVQQNLFIIQAEVAGADMTISEEKLRECEVYIDEGEKILPPITTFFISGGTELAVLCDISRTIARRAERRVVFVIEKERLEALGEVVQRSYIGDWTIAYLNRLSSLLYVMARLSNHFLGISEDAPSYK